MKTFLISAAFLAAATSVSAQAPSPQDRIRVFTRKVGEPGMVMAGAPADNLHFVAAEFSFEDKIAKDPPYSADAVTETTQTLADGNRISRKNTAQVFRDGEGRTRRDHTIDQIGPWASKSGYKSSIINDPVAGIHMILEHERKIARKMQLMRPTAGSYTRVPGPEGSIAFPPVERTFEFGIAEGIRVEAPGEEIRVRQMGRVATSQEFRNESLGTKVIEGVVAEGTRSTITIPAGQIGNERPIEIVSERWYSPELQAVVMTRRTDPRMGETTYKLLNVRRGEPGRHLFEVPPDYTVKEGDLRTPQVEVLRKIEGAPR